ncbi:hypothetical protein MNBD_PLANCTO02-3379 [hydrothermal vent metagenome]|uniref:Uncharacterized protein n=1 Tax=hydrothermal vent metagenome TaxID=652676 RepID=A0A3B1E832_9ZZZZ
MSQLTKKCRRIHLELSYSATIFGRIMLAVVLVCLCNTGKLYSQEKTNSPLPLPVEKETDGEGTPLPVPKSQETNPELPLGADIPPKDIPEIMRYKNENEPTIRRKIKELATIQKDASSAIFRRDSSRKGKELSKKRVEFLFLSMKLKSNRAKLSQLRSMVRADVIKSGRKLSSKKQKEKFRKFFLQVITDHCKALLDDNFYLRLNAVLILNDLELKERGSGKPATPFVPALHVLLKAIKNPKQHEAIKSVATKGIRKILMYGQTTTIMKLEIGKVLVKELNQSKNSAWYDMRLIQALSRVQIVRWVRLNGAPQPVIMQTLLDVMKDNKRDWQVRAEAARGLGLILLGNGDKEMEPKMIATEIIGFCDQMVDAYNANKKNNFWKNSFFKLYLAFKPRTEDGVKRKDGLVLRYGKDVDVLQAYDLIIPIVRHVLQQPNKNHAPVPDANKQNLSEWLKKSPRNIVPAATSFRTGKSSDVSSVK